MGRKAKPRIQVTEKTCRLCKKVKPIWEFHRRGQSCDGYHSACKPCSIAEQNRSRMKPRPILPEKACTMCGETKPMEDFVRNRNFFDGRNHVCKGCLYAQRRAYGSTTEGRAKLNEAQKKRYWSNPEAQRDLRAGYTHGVAPGTYAKLLALQGGVCAICGRDNNPGKTRFAFDHDHATNEVRGLLCTCCNQAIGQMQDSPDLLRKAAAYLENPPTRS